jgi:hypothetical protein
MPARDIVDVEVIVTDIEDEAAFSAPLQRLGFRRFNSPDLAAAGLRLFVPNDGGGRVHIYVCELGGGPGPPDAPCGSCTPGAPWPSGSGGRGALMAIHPPVGRQRDPPVLAAQMPVSAGP